MYPHLTTYSHELALPVIFESGWLHFAGGVKEYLELPEAPKKFLQTIPVTWDETKFLAGEPGEYVVLARQSGDSWYLAGINGEDAGRDVDVTLSFLGDTRCTVDPDHGCRDPADLRERETQAVTGQDRIEVRLKPYGGFAAVLTPCK